MPTAIALTNITLIKYWGDRDPRLHPPSLGLIAVGVELLRGDMRAIYALVLAVAALLATASWNARLILVEEEG